jgi:hypothetical protein
LTGSIGVDSSLQPGNTNTDNSSGYIPFITFLENRKPRIGAFL